MTAKRINFGIVLQPLKSHFEQSVETYWKNDKDGRINVLLLERIKQAKEKK